MVTAKTETRSGHSSTRRIADEREPGDVELPSDSPGTGTSFERSRDIMERWPEKLRRMKKNPKKRKEYLDRAESKAWQPQPFQYAQPGGGRSGDELMYDPWSKSVRPFKEYYSKGEGLDRLHELRRPDTGFVAADWDDEYVSMLEGLASARTPEQYVRDPGDVELTHVREPKEYKTPEPEKPGEPAEKSAGYKNIMAVLDKATPEEIDYWRNWYGYAHVEAVRLARTYDRPVDLVAAVMAVLSPKELWETNLYLADRALAQDWAQVKAMISNKSKAYALVVENDFSVLGTNQAADKVFYFFLSIVDPVAFQRMVVLDTHAINIWRGLREGKFKDLSKKDRQRLREDYQAAGDAVGLSPQALQAITWVLWRQYPTSKGTAPIETESGGKGWGKGKVEMAPDVEDLELGDVLGDLPDDEFTPPIDPSDVWLGKYGERRTAGRAERIQELQARFPAVDVSSLAALDPTNNGKYIDWIVRRSVAGEGLPADLPARLQAYDTLKNRRLVPAEYTDLNRLSVSQLAEALTAGQAAQQAREQQREEQRQRGLEEARRRQQEEAERRLLEEQDAADAFGDVSGPKLVQTTEDGFRVYEITDYETMRNVRAENAANWCVGYEHTDGHWRRYMEQNQYGRDPQLRLIETPDDEAYLLFWTPQYVELRDRDDEFVFDDEDHQDLLALATELAGKRPKTRSDDVDDDDYDDEDEDDEEAIAEAALEAYERTQEILEEDEFRAWEAEWAEESVVNAKTVALLSDNPALLAQLANHDDGNVRGGAAQNTLTPPEVLMQLANDDNERVRRTVANNTTTPPEALAQLANDGDAGVRWGVANNTATPPEALAQLANDADEHVRRGVANNTSTPPEVLAQLANDADEHVRRGVANNTSTPPEVLAQLANDDSEHVRWGVANNTSTPPEVLAQLANDDSEHVRRGVANNTSTPPEVLAQLANDDNERVREEAQRMLREGGQETTARRVSCLMRPKNAAKRARDDTPREPGDLDLDHPGFPARTWKEPKRKRKVLDVRPGAGLQNILTVAQEATPEEVDYWTKWYQGAADTVADMAAHFELPVETVAGVAAVLSPGSKWPVNVDSTEKVIQWWLAEKTIGTDLLHEPRAPFDVNFPLTAARPKWMDKVPAPRPYRPPEMPYEPGDLALPDVDREYDWAMAEDRELDPETGKRTKVQIPTGELEDADVPSEVHLPNVAAYPKNVAKAIKILESNDPSAYIKGPKVTVFFESLLNPDLMENDLTLDGHAINIWRGEKMPLKGLREPSSQERADMLADYDQAAKELGLTTQGLQALTWYIWKTTQLPASKKAQYDDVLRPRPEPTPEEVLNEVDEVERFWGYPSREYDLIRDHLHRRIREREDGVYTGPRAIPTGLFKGLNTATQRGKEIRPKILSLLADVNTLDDFEALPLTSQEHDKLSVWLDMYNRNLQAHLRRAWQDQIPGGSADDLEPDDLTRDVVAGSELQTPAALSDAELAQAVMAIETELATRQQAAPEPGDIDLARAAAGPKPGQYKLLSDQELMAYHKELLAELQRRKQVYERARDYQNQGGVREFRLGDVARIRIARDNAPDFWIQRNGSERSVGYPTADGHHPDWFGVWVKPGFDAQEVRTAVEYIWRRGYFQRYAHGTLQLQHIRLSDVKDAPLKLSTYPTDSRTAGNESDWQELQDLTGRGLWFSMADLPKFGINPGTPNYDNTPLGFYGYPLDEEHLHALSASTSGHQGLPMAGNRQYILVFAADPDLNLSEDNRADNTQALMQVAQQKAPRHIERAVRARLEAIEQQIVEAGREDDPVMPYADEALANIENWLNGMHVDDENLLPSIPEPSYYVQEFDLEEDYEDEEEIAKMDTFWRDWEETLYHFVRSIKPLPDDEYDDDEEEEESRRNETFDDYIQSVMATLDKPEHSGNAQLYRALNLVHWGQPSKFSAALRDLGIGAVYDPGLGVIHPNEPEQIVVVNPNAMRPVAIIENPMAQQFAYDAPSEIPLRNEKKRLQRIVESIQHGRPVDVFAAIMNNRWHLLSADYKLEGYADALVNALNEAQLQQVAQQHPDAVIAEAAQRRLNSTHRTKETAPELSTYPTDTREAAFEVEANKKLKRKLKQYYGLVEPAIERDPAGGKGYASWLMKFVSQTDWSPKELKVAVGAIVDVDRLAKYLRKHPDVAQLDPTLDALETYLAELEEAAGLDENRPQFNVISDNIVQTLNFEAARALHGTEAPDDRRMPWCGGRSRNLYSNYGGDGKERYLVFPNGPDEYVEVGGQEVPWSNYAFTISVAGDSLGNINDPDNTYPTDSSFDREGAERALGILNKELRLTLYLSDEEDEEDAAWEYAGLDRQEWVAAGITDFEEAEEWNSRNVEPEDAQAWKKVLPDMSPSTIAGWLTFLGVQHGTSEVADLITSDGGTERVTRLIEVIAAMLPEGMKDLASPAPSGFSREYKEQLRAYGIASLSSDLADVIESEAETAALVQLLKDKGEGKNEVEYDTLIEMVDRIGGDYEEGEDLYIKAAGLIHTLDKAQPRLNADEYDTRNILLAAANGDLDAELLDGWIKVMAPRTPEEAALSRQVALPGTTARGGEIPINQATDWMSMRAYSPEMIAPMMAWVHHRAEQGDAIEKIKDIGRLFVPARFVDPRQRFSEDSSETQRLVREALSLFKSDAGRAVADRWVEQAREATQAGSEAGEAGQKFRVQNDAFSWLRLGFDYQTAEAWHRQGWDSTHAGQYLREKGYTFGGETPQYAEGEGQPPEQAIHPASASFMHMREADKPQDMVEADQQVRALLALKPQLDDAKPSPIPGMNRGQNWLYQTHQPRMRDVPFEDLKRIFALPEQAFDDVVEATREHILPVDFWQRYMTALDLGKRWVQLTPNPEARGRLTMADREALVPEAAAEAASRGEAQGPDGLASMMLQRLHSKSGDQRLTVADLLGNAPTAAPGIKEKSPQRLQQEAEAVRLNLTLDKMWPAGATGDEAWYKEFYSEAADDQLARFIEGLREEIADLTRTRQGQQKTVGGPGAGADSASLGDLPTAPVDPTAPSIGENMSQLMYAIAQQSEQIAGLYDFVQEATERYNDTLTRFSKLLDQYPSPEEMQDALKTWTPRRRRALVTAVRGLRRVAQDLGLVDDAEALAPVDLGPTGEFVIQVTQNTGGLDGGAVAVYTNADATLDHVSEAAQVYQVQAPDFDAEGGVQARGPDGIQMRVFSPNGEPLDVQSKQEVLYAMAKIAKPYRAFARGLSRRLARRVAVRFTELLEGQTLVAKEGFTPAFGFPPVKPGDAFEFEGFHIYDPQLEYDQHWGLPDLGAPIEGGTSFENARVRLYPINEAGQVNPDDVLFVLPTELKAFDIEDTAGARDILDWKVEPQVQRGPSQAPSTSSEWNLPTRPSNRPSWKADDPVIPQPWDFTDLSPQDVDAELRYMQQQELQRFAPKPFRPRQPSQPPQSQQNVTRPDRTPLRRGRHTQARTHEVPAVRYAARVVWHDAQGQAVEWHGQAGEAKLAHLADMYGIDPKRREDCVLGSVTLYSPPIVNAQGGGRHSLQVWPRGHDRDGAELRRVMASLSA